MATSRARELRIVAAIEAIKGALVLIAAGILLRLLHADLQNAAEAIVRHFHLNPARHHPGVFVATVVDFGNAHKLALSFGALAYAAVRFVEAYGLWRARSWAWGFGIISAALYLPFELAELTQRVSWPAMTVLLLNVAVVLMLWRARSSAH
jgi:uncharacterized membrane protein (DUF2068 family)